MKIKDMFSTAAKRLRSGFVRFAPFNILTLLWALCLMRNNHLASDDAETKRLALSIAGGACWGMLAALAARLALERRNCRAWLVNSLPSACGMALAAVGTLFWYHVRAESSWYATWEMLYFGSLVSLGAFAGAQLFGKRNAWTAFGHIFLSAVFVVLVTFATWLGSMLCLMAYGELIAEVPPRIVEDVSIFVWSAMAPMFMAATLPKDNEPTEQPKAFTVLFWFLVPIGMLLLAILYAYIAKIVIAWSMPSGHMNWFASCAICGYLFFWLSLRGSRIRFFAFVARWGWAALLPVVATQVVGIVIRYNAHGLTTPRMAGMATLAIGVYALALAAFDRSAKSAFIVLAVAGILLTVSPFNIVDVPIRQQSARLRSALERTGCLVDGKLNVPENPNIPIEDAKVIYDTWEYLSTYGWRSPFCYSRREHDKTRRVRPGVWHGDAFANGIAETVLKLSDGKHSNLPRLLKADSEEVVHPRSRNSTITYTFHFDEDSGALDISCYKTLEAPGSSNLDHKDGKYFLTFKTQPKNRYDVTAHVKKLMDSYGAATNCGDGRYYHSIDLKAEDAVWELEPNLSIWVTRLYLHHPQGKQQDYVDYYILRK